VFRGHTNSVNDVAHIPNTDTAMSVSTDHTVRLWGLDNGLELARLTDHTSFVTSLDVSADGKYALSGDGRGQVILWDVPSTSAIRTFNAHDGAVWAVAFSPDMKSALTGGADNLIRQWRLDTGKQVLP
jgi:WD40 repeat protein